MRQRAADNLELCGHARSQYLQRHERLVQRCVSQVRRVVDLEVAYGHYGAQRRLAHELDTDARYVAQVEHAQLCTFEHLQPVERIGRAVDETELEAPMSVQAARLHVVELRVAHEQRQIGCVGQFQHVHDAAYVREPDFKSVRGPSGPLLVFFDVRALSATHCPRGGNEPIEMAECVVAELDNAGLAQIERAELDEAVAVVAATCVALGCQVVESCAVDEIIDTLRYVSDVFETVAVDVQAAEHVYVEGAQRLR